MLDHVRSLCLMVKITIFDSHNFIGGILSLCLRKAKLVEAMHSSVREPTLDFCLDFLRGSPLFLFGISILIYIGDLW
jgi:hypothetical protein